MKIKWNSDIHVNNLVTDGVTIWVCVIWSGWSWPWSSATWPNRWPASPWASQGGTQPRSFRGPWGPAAGRSWGGPRQGKFTRWGWSVSPQWIIFYTLLHSITIYKQALVYIYVYTHTYTHIHIHMYIHILLHYVNDDWLHLYQRTYVDVKFYSCFIHAIVTNALQKNL